MSAPTVAPGVTATKTAPGVIDTLPGDVPPFPAPNFLRGAITRRTSLPSDSLRSLARQFRTDPAVVLAGAVAILLTRPGGDSVLLALVHPDAALPVVFRAPAGPQSTVDSVLRQAVQAVSAPADQPSGPARILVTASGSPVPDTEAALAALAASGSRSAQYDTVFAAWPIPSDAGSGPACWTLGCDYAEDSYTAQAAEGFLERLELILDRLLREPATRLRELWSVVPVPPPGDPAPGAVAPGPVGPPRPPADSVRPDQDPALRALTPTELALAGIWSGILGRDPIRAGDDFFALGGHSLLAARVLGRVRAVFGVELGLDELFAAATLQRSAARIDAALRSGAPAADVPLVPGSGDGTLSFGQERLWLLEQGFRAGVYNVPLVMRLRGEADGEALRRCAQLLVDRHEVLRSGLVVGPAGQLRSLVTGHAAVPWAELDVRSPGGDGAGAGREDAAWDAVRAGVSEPFDLSVPPALRGGLVRYADDEWLMWLSIHHVACDGWSAEILLAELTAACQAMADGAEPVLEPLPVSYRDFAVWQRATAAGALDAGVAWWRDELAGAPRVLELPADRVRPATRSFAGGTVRWELAPELAEGVRELARESSATVFEVLLASFAALLSRWTGCTDLLVGSGAAGRERPELEAVVGFFVNTMVLRLDTSGDPSLRELVARVQRASLRAQAHSDVPFEALVDALVPERDAAVPPLVQVVFTMHRRARLEWELGGGVRARLTGADTGTAKFDLTCSVLDAGRSGMEVELEYASDLFAEQTARRFTAHWAELLRGLLACGSDARVQAVPALPEAERELLRTWSAGAGGGALTGSLGDAVAARAARSPGAVAVVDTGAGVSLTYAELLVRADDLADRLRKLGVGRGSLVGLACARGADLVVGMLGIIRAGAAYVPLDADYPADRLAFMLRDTGARVVAGQAQLLARLPLEGRAGVDVACPGHVGAGRGSGGSPSGPPADPGPGPDDAVYVMYTSGSTGQPKGVVIPHRGVLRLVREPGYVPLNPATVLAQMASASFDGITFEVWGALVNGGRTVVIPTDVVLAPGRLAATLRAEGVNTLFVTSALFTATVGEVPDAFAAIAHVFAGGDFLDIAPVATVLRERQSPGRLYDVYGPTEVTTFAVTQPLHHVPASRGAIGRPISHTQAYVADAGGGLAGIGVPGELLLGGAGLAWGYLNQPALTAQRFVPDPFGAEPGGRLYRTGDRVRWCPDGTLEFLGRVDRQLKIRGFRVEPGEVEAAILTHPAAEACVVMPTGHGATASLAGYVQSAAGHDLDGEGLREYLAARLPGYLIPSTLTIVARLPINANGKVDRDALPEPAAVAAAVSGHQPPRDPVEEVLAAIWAEVLGLDRVGVHDSFFAIGGHSLHAAQVSARVERRLRTPLTIRELLDHPTVAALASHLSSASGDPARLARVASVVLRITQLSPTQRRAELYRAEGEN